MSAPATPNSAPQERSPRQRALVALAVAALAATHVGLATTSAARKSATFDEGFHLTAGYTNWLENDHRLHSGNGLLAQMWFALPLVARPDVFRFPNPDAIIDTQPVRDFHELTIYLAHVFFYEVGNDHRQILAHGRIMAAVLGAMLCVGVFLWSRRLFGTAPALLSCALCALSPNVLAHARLTTSDLLFTVTLLAALAFAWRSLWRPGVLEILTAGAALGALALTKLSALGVIPMLALLVTARALWPLPPPAARRRPETRTHPIDEAGRTSRAGKAARAGVLFAIVVLEGLIAVGVIWAAYGLRFDAIPPGRGGREAYDQQWAWALERESPVLDGIALLREQRLLPEAYLFSAAFVWRQADERRTFFRGHASSGGDWRFFPYAIAVKTPLGLFALLAIAVGVGIATARGGSGLAARGRAPPAAADFARVAAPLAVLTLVHGGFALTAEINLGLRHVLPLYAVAFICAGGAAAGLSEARLARRVAVGIAGLAFAASSLAIWPHYLAYFNALVGPERAYRQLVDSSLDWGQDLDGLAPVIAERAPDRGPVHLAYFGTADPLHHGFDVERLPGFFDWPSWRNQWDRVRIPVRLRPGLYAISATVLQQAWSAVPNPIDPAHEDRYAELRAHFAPVLEAEEGERALAAALADPQLRARWLEFRELRLAQLCRELRRREPDANVGYSLLLYEVDEAELARALTPDRSH